MGNRAYRFMKMFGVRDVSFDLRNGCICTFGGRPYVNIRMIVSRAFNASWYARNDAIVMNLERAQAIPAPESMYKGRDMPLI